MPTTRLFPYVRPGASAAVAGLAAALVLTGCTGGRDGSARPAPEPSSALTSSAAPSPASPPASSPPTSSRASSSASPPGESPASDRSRHLPGESVTEAPELPGSKVVARAANGHGNAEIEVPGGIGPGSLSIAVNCEGRGTLNVSVDPTGLSFPLTCAAGKVGGVLNRMDVRHGHGHGHGYATVTVAAPSGIHWSLAVGR